MHSCATNTTLVRSMRTHCTYVQYYARARKRSTAVRTHASHVHTHATQVRASVRK